MKEELSTTYAALQKRLGKITGFATRQHLDAKTIFLSATPAEYELSISDKIVEQIIRPTGLLDPITYVYPKSGDFTPLLESIEALVKKKPHLKEFLDGYSLKDGVEEVFN